MIEYSSTTSTCVYSEVLGTEVPAHHELSIKGGCIILQYIKWHISCASAG